MLPPPSPPLGTPPHRGLRGVRDRLAVAGRYARRLLARDRRLQLRVMLSAVVVLTLLWGGASLYLAGRAAQEVEQARHDTANLALAFEQHVERTLRGVDQVMLLIKSDYERDPKTFKLQAWLEKAVLLNDLSLQIGIAEASGTVIMSTLGNLSPAVSLRDREHFRVHADGKVDGLFISAPVLGRLSGKWSIQMTRRLSGPDGGFAGIIVISLDPFYLSSLFGEVDLGSRGVVTLLGTDGIIRARAPLDPAELGRSLAGLPAFQSWRASRSGTEVAATKRGVVIRSHRVIADLPLIVTVSVDRDEILAPVRTERRILLGVLAPLSGLVILLSGGFVREIERRQRQQALLIGKGVELDSANKAVAQANLELEDKVLARTAELEANQRRLETTIEQLTATSAELAAQENMASLGRVVAGVAHEVNTPLGVAITASSSLSGAAEAFNQQVAGGTLRRSDLTAFVEAVTEATDMISTNLGRAANLVRSFKQVAADQHGGEPRRVDLAAYLSDITTSLKPEIRRHGHSISVESAEPIELDLRVDALWQVVSNLVMNALAHGYPDGRRGRLRLTLAREADNAVIRFRDDGQGMAPEVRDNVFEPFFTTKRGNGGTGLGLSIVFTLVTRVLGGQITCLSEPGAGAEFVIALPIGQQPRLSAAA